MISHFFEFRSTCEDCVIDVIETAVKIQNSGKEISRSFKLHIKLKNFPEVSLKHRSFSVINSMVNKGAGCLLFLENLTILDFSSRINFKSRIEFRTECRCNNSHKKIKKYSLKDFLKLNCDLSTKKSTSRIPECSFCGT